MFCELEKILKGDMKRRSWLNESFASHKKPTDHDWFKCWPLFELFSEWLETAASKRFMNLNRGHKLS
jgi:hypothetical protein